MKKLFALLTCLFLFLASPALASDGDPILLPGNTDVVTIGTVATGVWEATDVGVAHGGTGVSTLTDGGILLGSGVGALTPMAVLADGSVVVGDGATDPVSLAVFTSSTGTAKHEVGGLEVDVSAWTNGVPVVNAGATSALTFYDEDNMATNSATGLASQQSVKAYVDNTVASGGAKWGTNVSKTVAAGTLTTGGDFFMDVAGESATTDSVTSITGAAVGDMIILKGVAGLSYTITFVDGGTLALQADFLMDNTNDILTLICTAAPATFAEVSRASNG